MIKKVVCITVVGFGLMAIGCNVMFEPCPGQQNCGNGCAPLNATCCSSSTYCDQGYMCGPGDTCLPAAPVNACESCLANGEQCCPNYDGTVDCAPINSQCCMNHTHCNSGYCCSGGCC